ncbi:MULTISPECIES: YihY/virulence factor BrkB family protein [Actinomadura]|uniref:YihY/virulence factor BrkB family protein n=1 Tax=Actinomadura yumaensis TaxID=111807 RepID=A0ABW2CX96_9ACTN|nr:YihY/virulence factor BrkB family protein [Actinomadura sp. J1-007]MWK36049.1 YihY/virulence factor BrkB family protein [Actinomadura sp. J1-007]
MRQVIGAAGRRAGELTEAGKDLLRGARERWRAFDHLGRAYERYQETRGDRLAAALTSYGFLSFFPLLALAYSLLGYLVGVSDEARDYFVRAVNSLLPGLSDQLQVEQIARSKNTVGLFGLAGLVLTGLGWVQALRESLRVVWGNEPVPDGNFAVKKLWDAAVLAFLGAMLVVGMVISTVATSASHTVLDWLGLAHVPGAGTGLALLSLLGAVATNTLIFLFLFSRLSATRAPWRRIIRGALFGAVGLEILKQLATLLLGHTTRNPVYASFAVLVGLMVWINLASRFLLFVAAWTATRMVVLEADQDETAEDGPAEGEPAGDAADADAVPDGVRNGAKEPALVPQPKPVRTRRRRRSTGPRPASGSR